MGGIKVRGAQLLHGLWSHAERVILQGGKPPPPSGIGGGGGPIRIGPGTLRNAFQTQKTRQLHLQVVNKKRIPYSFSTSVRCFVDDAFFAVFKGIKQPMQTDTIGAAQVRTIIRSSRLQNNGIRRPRTMFNAQHRPYHVPHKFAPAKGETNKVGLALVDNFCHSSLGFEQFVPRVADQFVVHAPLALRAAADELEDGLQTHYRSRAKAARRVGMANSTQRSGQLTHKVTRYAAAVEPAVKTLEKGVQASEEHVHACSSSSVSQASCAFEESFDDIGAWDNYFTYPEPSLEPTVVTQLLIPLCPDLTAILAPSIETDDRDDETLEGFLSHAGRVMDEFSRHRLKRIVAIERAFDQEPLRAYRPASWTEDMFVELFSDDDDSVKQICLSVHFPHCTAADVREMLMQAMSNESARWFSNFLRERKMTPSPSFDDTPTYSLLHSPAFSSQFTDLGPDVDGMGVASQVSMDDQRNSHTSRNPAWQEDQQQSLLLLPILDTQGNATGGLL